MVYDGKSTYMLPQSFIDQMSTLEKMLVNPSKPEVKYVKNFRDTKTYKQNIIDKKTDRHWVKEKTNVAPFKVTVMEVKEGLEKDINDIRKAMNMISKNFETQKEIIISFVIGIVDDKDSLVKISTFIFDIASSNMFYGDIYADLYVYFIVESSLFKDVLQDTAHSTQHSAHSTHHTPHTTHHTPHTTHHTPHTTQHIAHSTQLRHSTQHTAHGTHHTPHTTHHTPHSSTQHTHTAHSNYFFRFLLLYQYCSVCFIK